MVLDRSFSFLQFCSLSPLLYSFCAISPHSCPFCNSVAILCPHPIIVSPSTIIVPVLCFLFAFVHNVSATVCFSSIVVPPLDYCVLSEHLCKEKSHWAICDGACYLLSTYLFLQYQNDNSMWLLVSAGDHTGLT